MKLHYAERVLIGKGTDTTLVTFNSVVSNSVSLVCVALQSKLYCGAEESYCAINRSG
ncbi:hypothetical protein MLPF_3334 [Mycobacterium lepromatosis]|nr:hypothetical protein MLPF_3334 [Mycobacterium lepromatosis]